MRAKLKGICGVGINDAEYEVYKYDNIGGKSKVVWTCPFYSVWKSMICRCFSKKEKARIPSYLESSCVEEWFLFSNFKVWMETQDWEGKQLDKDLLVRGNKIYGPTTCLFVTQQVNLFLLERARDRGSYPLGVCWHKGTEMYIAKCNRVDGSSAHIGYFSTPEEAHKAWQLEKYKQSVILANMQTDNRVAKALVERYKL